MSEINANRYDRKISKYGTAPTEKASRSTTAYQFNSFVVLFVEIELGLDCIVGSVDMLSSVSES